MFNLDFAKLDDLAIAVQRRGVNPIAHLANLQPDKIGPLLELLLLSRSPELASLSPYNVPRNKRIVALSKALETVNLGNGIYVSSEGRSVGFIATSRNSQEPDTYEWTQFCRRAQAGAESAGLVGVEAKGLIGAMREMEENIHLHSNRTLDGIVAFSSNPKEFEFVVADSGNGVLASLKRNPNYTYLSDAGTALRYALTDGHSRFGSESGHGFGFHGLFVGLANLNGSLRFRTEDHALLIDGTGPNLITSRIAQKSRMQGFLISVLCSPLTPTTLH